MRGKTSKRLRKNTLGIKPSKFVLLEIANEFGERTKQFSGTRSIYKAAKDVYKLYRKTGEHKKADLFLRKES